MKRINCSGTMHIQFRQARRFRREMTDSEKLLWSRLRGNRLFGLHFRRQHVVHGFIVDFYCHKAKLVVEIDGSVHESQLESDQLRDSILIADGLSILHLPVAMVEGKLEDAVGAIGEKCRDRISGCEATALCPLPRMAD
jgi:very-short-patch-repair endonuclease